MTRLSTLLTLLPIALVSRGQDISMTFSSKSSAVQIDSITATNLATGQQVTLPGHATLLLTPKTGIPSSEEAASNGMILPNPFPGTATLIAFVAEPQTVYLKMQNLTGQTIAQTEAFLQPGENEFGISVSAPGIYLVGLYTNRHTNSYKIISTGTSGTGDRVKYLRSALTPVTRNLTDTGEQPRKAGFNAFSLAYSAGETIRYLCMSGKFSATITDSPMESKNYEVEFPPIASFTIEPAEGTTETKFQFDATGCADAETPADELEARWDLDGDGNWDIDWDTGKFGMCQYQWAGSYPVSLEVRDASGLSDTVTISVHVANAPAGTFTDPRDNNKYPYKTIGTQVWMTKNLAWLPSVSPPAMGSDTASCYYVHGYGGTQVSAAKQQDNYKTYGVLYNAPAARNACPKGWHISTDEEWLVLEKLLGMSDADLYNPNGVIRGAAANVGGKLKETGTLHWLSPNAGATDEVGFTSVPGGARRPQGDFLDFTGISSQYWTSTPVDGTHTLSRVIANSLQSIGRLSTDPNSYGESVRCIRD